LSHTSSPFCSGYFGGGILWTICPGWPWTEILPISASQVARITDINHSAQVSISVFSFFLCAVLGFKLRASCLLGRCSTTWATSPAEKRIVFWLKRFLFLKTILKLVYICCTQGIHCDNSE
jgi:hypothetical protein